MGLGEEKPLLTVTDEATYQLLTLCTAQPQVVTFMDSVN